MKDLKYVFAYITPLGAVMGLWLQGVLGVFYALFCFYFSSFIGNYFAYSQAKP